MPEIDLASLRRWRRDVDQQGEERARLLRTLSEGVQRLHAQDAEISRLVARGDHRAADDARRARAEIESQNSRHHGALVDFDRGFRDVIGDFAGRGDVGDADPSVPLVLLPVRIETRFTRDQRALRVRVFPDDIHIDALDAGVTDAEGQAASDYWTAVWRATDADAETAFRTLTARVGARRAQWVATATRPTNLDLMATDAAPMLRAPPPRSRRAAVARLMPDAFTVVAIQGEARSSRTGKALLPEIVVGLFAGDGSKPVDINGIKVPAGGEWMADYDKAEELGMAVTVPLSQPGRVDRLLVYGIKRSLDRDQARAELESQLLAHRCTGGVAFVPQGTPTNNTETNRAGWQRGVEPRAPVLKPAPIDANSNAAVLAGALGIDASALAELEHATDREQLRARAMNIAMWGPSWGGFLDKINRVGPNGATLSDAAREDVRLFHRDHVRGRGPLPALRIGDQPYAFLPVSSAPRWRTERADRFEAKLREFIDKLRIRWRQCIARVPRLGSGPIDDVLLEMLGSSPVSTSVRARPVLSETVTALSIEASGSGNEDAEMQHILDMLLWEELHDAGLVQLAGVFGESRPIPLPYVHESDPGFIEKLIAGGYRETLSVFQALIELAWTQANSAVDKESAGGMLATILANATTLAEADRQGVLALANRADAAEPQAFYAAARTIARTFDEAPPTHAEYQPVPSLARSFGEMALESSSELARPRISAYAAHAWLNARGRLNELAEALKELHDTTLDERRILFAESLDIASHRLDAWITAIVERRRKDLRVTNATGLTLGAYGWVENLVPQGNRMPDGGFLHAPNMTQAATASVLRSAYLSHNDEASGDGAFAIDLSSARVRTALHLVEGIRQGQPLGALLGYRIERALHVAQLDRFVLSLRAIAPLTAGQLTDRDDAVMPQAQETIAAANVLDGVVLIERFKGKVADWDANAIKVKLEAVPSDNPYLAPGSWVPPSVDEWTTIGGIILDAAAALDAVGDLLLAESVHMLVAGSPARASAALDAASGGDSPPPEPLFVATPADGSMFTHRVLAVVGADVEGWNVTRPRSAAEPRLEAWAAAHLGTPDTIALCDDAEGRLLTVGQTGLCALDLVYEAANRERFARFLAVSVAGLRKLHEMPRPTWPAGMRAIGEVFECARALRSVLVNARPATPADLMLPHGGDGRSVDAAELAAAHARAETAANSLALTCTLVDALVNEAQSSPDDIRAALSDFAAYGISVPSGDHDEKKESDASLRSLAGLFVANARRKVEEAMKSLALPQSIDSVTAASQALFEDGFWILPVIGKPTAPDAWTRAYATPPSGASAGTVCRVLADVGAVRDGVRRCNEALLLAEGLGARIDLRVAQLTGAYGIQPVGWVGSELPLHVPTPTVPVLSAIVDVVGSYDGTGSTIALVLDEWLERVPLREVRGEGPDAPIDERVTSGVSFNALSPSARAPQAILLAVSPDGARWTHEAIVATLEETLELARFRGVTLERTNGIARILPALYEQSWSLQGEKVLDLSRLVANEIPASSAYVKELSS